MRKNDVKSMEKYGEGHAARWRRRAGCKTHADTAKTRHGERLGRHGTRRHGTHPYADDTERSRLYHGSNRHMVPYTSKVPDGCRKDGKLLVVTEGFWETR